MNEQTANDPPMLNLPLTPHEAAILAAECERGLRAWSAASETGRVLRDVMERLQGKQK